MQETNILLVEDDRMIIENLTEFLKTEGFQVWSADGQEKAMKILRNQHFDLILLDITLAQGNGYSTCTQIKSHYEIPIIFLTALDDEFSVVTGLDMGADDYLVKPFAFEELIARIRAITRKASGNASNIFQLADLTLDVSARSVTRAGKNITLSAKEFALLEYMMHNKGIVLTREMIENNLWNYDYSGGTNAVDVYIRYLRKKIDDEFDKKLIHTVRGIGYVLREE